MSINRKLEISSSAVQPYTINVAESILSDLRQRLENTRWGAQIEGLGWDGGMDGSYLRELVDYWREGYDWRREEQKLNQFSHYRTEIDDIVIHFVYERGKGPAPFPVVLTHGYPDSFYRFVKLIPLLTDPVAFGGRAEDAFDVVVPDIPGYGFSDSPGQKGVTFHVSALWARLMTERLGYTRFGAHGGDWGSTITEQLARQHSSSVIAIHLTDVPFGHLLRKPDNPSSDEQRLFRENEEWLQKEGAYALIQSTKPQSLAPGLNDSPSGLAAWIIEKFRAWSDCGGDVQSRFTKDELLTNVMIYWITQSIGTSFQTYFDYSNAGAMTWLSQGLKNWMGSSAVPAAFSIFPADIGRPPREWAERFFNVQRWTEMPRGGHFAAMEEPGLLAEDLREWFRGFR
jgi:microsomal epoxide hydrolase